MVKMPMFVVKAKKKRANFEGRQTLDPVNKCFLPGVPRIMYMPYPFRINQTPTHIALTFEYSHAYRMIYTNGTKHPEALEFWMGDSRGRWEGDTLVVSVADLHPETWFDKAGNHHSDALRLTERITARSPETLNYEVTVEDPNVFTRPWKMSMPLYRRAEKNLQRAEFRCVPFTEELIYGHLRKPGTPTPR